MEASANTVAGYRDTFRLLLRFASEQRRKAPTRLRIEDLDAELIGNFLVHVETARQNGARSRNTRLAAIRSFFRCVAMNEPAHLLHCQRILTMSGKRYVKRTVTFLDREEIAALLAAPDRSTWVGRRDHVLLLVALQTGLRASELINLQCKDVVLGTGAHIRCDGKGRKERCTPLRRDTVKLLEQWLRERRGGDDQPLFPSMRGDRLKPRCAGAPRPQARTNRISVVPVAPDQARQPAHPQAQHGDGAIAARRRSDGNCPLALPRIRRDDAGLHSRRSANEGESVVPVGSAGGKTRPISPE
jgi:integrase